MIRRASKVLSGGDSGTCTSVKTITERPACRFPIELPRSPHLQFSDYRASQPLAADLKSTALGSLDCGPSPRPPSHCPCASRTHTPLPEAGIPPVSILTHFTREAHTSPPWHRSLRQRPPHREAPEPNGREGGQQKEPGLKVNTPGSHLHVATDEL